MWASLGLKEKARMELLRNVEVHRATPYAQRLSSKSALVYLDATYASNW